MNVLTVPEACLVQMQYSKNAAHMLHILHIVGWPYETGTYCLMYLLVLSQNWGTLVRNGTALLGK